MTTKRRDAPIPQIAGGLPSDGYGRGATAPVLPNQPTLFYRAGLENICEARRRRGHRRADAERARA